MYQPFVVILHCTVPVFHALELCLSFHHFWAWNRPVAIGSFAVECFTSATADAI